MEMRKRLNVVRVDFDNALVLTKAEGAMTVQESRQMYFDNLTYTKVNDLTFWSKFKLMFSLVLYIFSEKPSPTKE